MLQQTLDLDRQPVVSVSWQDAAEYSNWLSAQEGLQPAYVKRRAAELVPVVPATNGYRLPTEAEWEWAARGAGGALAQVPLGRRAAGARRAPAISPTARRSRWSTQVLPDYDDGYAATAPVGSFAANPAGFFDLGGNVAEWTHDLYTVQPASGAAAVDPAAGGAGATARDPRLELASFRGDRTAARISRLRGRQTQ